MRLRFTVCILTGAVLLSLGIVPANAQEEGPGGCGPLDAKHKTTTHADKRPTPSPAPGKALIYIIRSGSMRAFFQVKLAANGRWIDVLPRGNYYAFAEIEPGVVRLCADVGANSEPRPDGFAVLTAEAGKSYYFDAKFSGGFRPGVALAEVDETRGTALLAQSRFVTFEEDR